MSIVDQEPSVPNQAVKINDWKKMRTSVAAIKPVVSIVSITFQNK